MSCGVEKIRRRREGDYNYEELIRGGWVSVHRYAPVEKIRGCGDGMSVRWRCAGQRAGHYSNSGGC